MSRSRFASLALVLAGIASAQEPPLRIYSTRDGLAHDRVNDIVRDSFGYLWFATWEGVTCFDGRRMQSYGTADGLPNPLVWRIAEDAHGMLWFATAGGGVARLIDEPGAEPARSPAASRRAFATLHLGENRAGDSVYDLAFDAQGCMWCWTSAGLFRGAPRAGTSVEFDFELALPAPASEWSVHFAKLADGELVCIGRDVVLRWRDGQLRSTAHPVDAELGDLEDVERGSGDGHWLVAYDRGLFDVDLGAIDSGDAAWRRIPLAVPEGKIYRVARDERGVIWGATTRGLVRFDGEQLGTLTSSDGLPDDWVQCIVFDRSAGLWLGTHRGGAAHILDSGLESTTRASGLADPNVARLLESRDGRMWAWTELGGTYQLTSHGAVIVAGSDVPPFNDIRARVLQDHRGNWWLGTDHGVHRIAGDDPDFSRAQLCTDDWGLPPGNVFGEIREDTDGAIWLAMLGPALYRLDAADAERGSGRFEQVAITPDPSPPRVACSDAAGTLWIATNERVWRRRAGAWQSVLPATLENGELRPRGMQFDARGWLWIGTRFEGLFVARDPSADAIAFEHFSTVRGLASDAVYGITGDERGRMYVATTKGLDRLDPSTGEIEHWTTSDGLAGNSVNQVLIDRKGRVWAATSGGASRLDPTRSPHSRPAPPTYLTRVIVGGEERPLPSRGSARVAEITCSADESRWIFEWSGVDPAASAPQLFSIRLEGAESQWSEPTDQTSVRYAQLAPGTYAFRVRSVSTDGKSFGEPAEVALHVLPPFWRQWWFFALVAGSVSGAGYALHRVRLARALALERIRTQIATDLHDDVGAGLAQIAILSEVAKRADVVESRDVLGEVAELARGLRVSMSDLVWAVDPRRDTLGDLVRRMRQFANDLLGASALELEFRAPEDAAIDALELAPDRRRNLLYLFREAVTNVARHAQARRVSVEIRIAGRRLSISIRDDGRGFDTSASYRGNGLDNLRRRAAQLGAELRLESAPGGGTHIEVDLPLRAS